VERVNSPGEKLGTFRRVEVQLLKVLIHSCGTAATRRERFTAVHARRLSGSLVVSSLGEVKPNFASELLATGTIVC
jgi:hypothetical protein